MWEEATRVITEKQSALLKQRRRFRLRRVMRRASAILVTTVVVIMVNTWLNLNETASPFDPSPGAGGTKRENTPGGELCIEEFNDLNGDGVQDAGEEGLSSFVFQVNGTGPATMLMTSPSGVVCTGLPVGAYTVVEQPRNGWTATTPTTQTVTVTAGQTANLFFGNRLDKREESGEICIRQFDDANGNGVQDSGEKGLSGLVLRMSGAGRVATVTTDSNGLGCATLLAGAYTVVGQPQAGWMATTPAKQTVTITAGRTANLLFGNRQERGDLCIGKFNDLNGNGVHNADEKGLAQFVFRVTGKEYDTTLTTDPNGVACTELSVGTYTVEEQPKSGWTATTATKRTVTITAGGTASVSFGNRQESGKLCIGKFNDLNGNGLQDPGEPGLSGFVFRVSGTGKATRLTTGPDGVACTELTVGPYTLEEQPQTGWIATTSTKQPVTITAGQTASLFFGNRRDDIKEKGELCIVAFHDRNRNSVKDAGEPGLSGFAFQVSGTDITTTLTTDENPGLPYDPKRSICKSLPVGDYTVVGQPQTGWTATTLTTQTVTVTANQAVPLFFGNIRSDTACSDADKSRETQIIVERYSKDWHDVIEKEIIASTGEKEIVLRLLEYPTEFFGDCTVAQVTVIYEWWVGKSERQKTSGGKRRFDCSKQGDVWDCPTPRLIKRGKNALHLPSKKALQTESYL
jgi:predicted RNA-binding Zn ribbon-like protein